MDSWKVYSLLSYQGKLYRIISNHIESCHVTSNHSISNHVTSRRIKAHHIESYHIESHHTESYHIELYHIESHHIISSNHVTSNHIWSWNHRLFFCISLRKNMNSCAFWTLTMCAKECRYVLSNIIIGNFLKFEKLSLHIRGSMYVLLLSACFYIFYLM